VDRPLANRKVFWFRFDELLGIAGDESEGVQAGHAERAVR
jgi:hypothetical protein